MTTTVVDHPAKKDRGSDALSPAQSLAHAAATNAEAERLTTLLRDAYDAVVTVDHFARAFVDENTSQLSPPAKGEDEDVVDRGLRLLAGELGSLDPIALELVLRAAEDLCSATRIRQEAALRELEERGRSDA